MGNRTHGSRGGSMEQLNLIELGSFLGVDFPPPAPICEGLINHGEFVILSAASKVGKSKFAMSLSLAVSKGIKFLEHFETHRGNVFYLQTEISNGEFQKRLRDCGYESEVGDAKTLLSNDRINLMESKSFEILSRTIEQHEVKLMILDPFYTLHRGDECSQYDMHPLLTNLSLLAKKHNIGIFLIHHQGKQNEIRGSFQTGHHHRGSSAFGDVPDGSLSLRTMGKNQLKLSFEFRNRPTPDPLEIEPVGLGFKVIGELEVIENKKIDHLVGVIKKFENGVSRSEILKFCELNGIGKERAVNGMLKKLTEEKILKREMKGKTAFYYDGSTAIPLKGNAVVP